MIEGYILRNRCGAHLTKGLFWLKEESAEKPPFVHSLEAIHGLVPRMKEKSWIVKPIKAQKARFIDGRVETDGEPIPFEELIGESMPESV